MMDIRLRKLLVLCLCVGLVAYIVYSHGAGAANPGAVRLAWLKEMGSFFEAAAVVLVLPVLYVYFRIRNEPSGRPQPTHVPVRSVDLRGAFKLPFYPFGALFSVLAIGLCILLVHAFVNQATGVVVTSRGDPLPPRSWPAFLFSAALVLVAAAVFADRALRRATLLLTSDQIQQRDLSGLTVIRWEDVRQVGRNGMGLTVTSRTGKNLACHLIGLGEYQEVIAFMKGHLEASIAEGLRYPSDVSAA